MQILLFTVLILSLPFMSLGETKEGTCKLKKISSSVDDDIFKVQVGNQIKGTCKFYIGDFMGEKAINVKIDVMNISDKIMHCHCYISLFDKAGNLICCSSHGSFKDGIAVGAATALSSCPIPLPKGFHEQVVQYKIAFYEAGNEIGK